MIKEFKATSGFAANLSCLKDKKFTFKHGLNILFGPNGCGKSTTLKIIGAYCGIKTGGWSGFPTPFDLKSSIHETTDKIKLPLAFRNMSPGKCEGIVDWDGTATFLNHSTQDSPLASTLFDSAEESPDGMTDMVEQVGLIMGKFSEGQLRLHKLGKIVQIALNPPDLTKLPKTNVNDVWLKTWNAFAKYVQKLNRKGPATLLLDEPDKSLSIENQIALWKDMFPKIANKAQLIVASHSPFCVSVKANFIDMEKGYLDKTRKAIKDFYG